MANIEGSWDTVAHTQMGPQRSEMTFNVDGASFTGESNGPMGTVELEEGVIAGDKITWSMKFMGMSLKGEAIVDGDTMAGHVVSPMGDAKFEGSRNPV